MIRRLGVGGTLAALVLLLAGCGSGAGAPSAAGANSGLGIDSATQSQALGNPDLNPGATLGGRAAPPFTLTDQFGRAVSLAQLRGHVVVLAFVDAECTTVCPLTTTSMLMARSMLGAAGRQVQLVGIDANPDATAVSDVAAYSDAHQMTNQWLFLTGPPSRLSAVWKDYDVYVAASAGNIDHEPAVYVINPAGRESAVYITSMAYDSIGQQAQLLADGIAAALPGHVAAAQTTTLRYQTPITPNQQASLPLADGSGTVALGPGHPHVLVFFASWLTQTEDLRAQLAALSAYSTAARAHGWPPLVAVDESGTEASPGALPAFLRTVGRLDFPVAVDTTGRVSDGYGVQGLPWVSLVGSTGRIVAQNNGLFTVPQLEAAVRRARLGG